MENIDRFGPGNFNIFVRDWSWWNENDTEIYEWLDNCTTYGTKGCMGQHIVFHNKNELLWFTLRWNRT